jgi:hypothetical protein
MAPDHKQYSTDLWQQGQQEKPKHGEILRFRSQHAAGAPCD